MSDFDKIKVRKSHSMDHSTWTRKMKVVQLLCEMGVVTEWIDETFGPYKHVPRKYLIDGICIEFYPEWNHYLIEGEIQTALPDSIHDISNALSHHLGL